MLGEKEVGSCELWDTVSPLRRRFETEGPAMHTFVLGSSNIKCQVERNENEEKER